MVMGLIHGVVSAGLTALISSMTKLREPVLPKATNSPTMTAKVISIPCTKSVHATASRPPAEV